MNGNELELIDQVNALMRENEKYNAYDLLKEYIANNVSSSEIYLKIGGIAQELKLSKAILHYKEGLAIYPDDQNLNMALGILYFNNKKFADAEKYLLKLWIEDPTNAILLTMLGKIYKSFKRFEKAMKYFKLCELLEPDNSFALYGIADTYRGIGDNKNALRYWLKFNEIEPNNRLAITRIGDCYARLNEKENALQFYRRALEIDYDFFAHLGSAKIYVSLGEPNKSHEIFEQIFPVEQNNRRYFYEYIDLCLATGLKKKALELYSLASGRFPGDTHLKSFVPKFSSNS